MGLPNYPEYLHWGNPFSLAFETNVVIPTEIGIPSHWIANFDEAENAYLIASNLELMGEKGAKV